MSYRVYTTKGVVLKKKTSGEQNSILYLLTQNLGLIIVSARSTRSAHSKLKGLVEDYSYGDFSLVKGKNGWRLTNVSQEGNFFFEAEEYSRKTIAQISSILIKMIQGEVVQPEIFGCVLGGYKFLTKTDLENVYLAEILIVLRVMNLLGYVEGGEGVQGLVLDNSFDEGVLQKVSASKIEIVGIINKAIKASQL